MGALYFAINVLEMSHILNSKDYDRKYDYLRSIQEDFAEHNKAIFLWLAYARMRMRESFWKIYSEHPDSCFNDIDDNSEDMRTLKELIEKYKDELLSCDRKDMNSVEYTIHFFTDIMDLAQCDTPSEDHSARAYLRALKTQIGHHRHINMVLDYFLKVLDRQYNEKFIYEPSSHFPNNPEVHSGKSAIPTVDERRWVLARRRKAKMRLDADCHTGYYKIFAKSVDGQLYSWIQYHRGKGLPNLENRDDLVELLYPAESKVQMCRDKIDRIYRLSLLDTIFTQEEVAKIIKVAFSDSMYIHVEPVLIHGLDNFMSSSCMPCGRRKHGGHDMFLSNDVSIFKCSVDWTLEPYNFDEH